MPAQTVALHVMAFEYRALMAQLVLKARKPSKQPTANMSITFVVDLAQQPLAPEDLTARKYTEAKWLLDDVIAKHAKTPWADHPQDILNRDLSVKLNEWHHNRKYDERSQFMPKF